MTIQCNFSKEKGKEYKIEVIRNGDKPDWLLTDSPQIKGFQDIIGVDTEYINDESNNRQNLIISWQICAYSQELRRYVEMIIYLYKQETKEFTERLDLGRIIAITLENLGYNWWEIKKKKKRKILIISHFWPAEWTSLERKDREKLGSERLPEIQKTMASFKEIKWKVPKYWSEQKNTDRSKLEVQIQLRDTILLAPDGYKTLKALSTITQEKKVELEEWEIKNMKKLLEENPEKFRKYAINDARIVIEFYCLFMEEFYKLSGCEDLPITASGAAEKLLIKEVERLGKELGIKNLLNTIFGLNDRGRPIENKILDEAYANLAYLGGKNGIYKYVEKIKGRLRRLLIIDLDIDGAYSRALALLIVIIWETRFRKSFTAGEYALAKAETYNKEPDHYEVELYNTKFNFPEEVYDPVLPQKTKWGLIYTRKGRTVATQAEMYEAIRLGAIKSEDVEEIAKYQKLRVNEEYLKPFAIIIGKLKKKRKEAKIKEGKGCFRELLIKLMINSIYGKMAQGLEYRSIFNKSGEKKALKPSKIADAHYAGLTTAAVRVALSSMINTIKGYEGCEVLNCTTDGLMMTMSLDCEGAIWKGEEYPEFEVWKEGEEYEDMYGKRKLSGDKILDSSIIGRIKKIPSLKEINPILYEKLTENKAVKMLIRGGKNMGDESEWLEVKNIGDEGGSYQTRANWISWKGITQGLARGNISRKIVNRAETLQKYAESDEIMEISLDTLVGIKDIWKAKEKDGEEWDLVKKLDKREAEPKRKVNIGPDSKRKLEKDGSNTRAFEDLKEAWEERKTVEYMVKKGIRRKPENVLFYMESKKVNVRVRGSKKETIIRMLISIAIQNDWMQITYGKLSKKIEEELGIKIEKETIKKSWKKKKVLKKSIPNNQEVREIALKIANLFKIDDILNKLEDYLQD